MPGRPVTARLWAIAPGGDMGKKQFLEFADNGMLTGAERRTQSVTAEWEILRDLVHGVQLKEVRHVPKANGYVTELFRRDWGLDGGEVDQVFQVSLDPGTVSAWHMHRNTTDRLFASQGSLLIVLYDARRHSPSYGRINELRLGTVRPALVSVPPGVWHGVQNTGATPAALINVVDRAYAYDAPDHWALPADTEQIPYSFRAGPQAP